MTRVVTLVVLAVMAMGVSSFAQSPKKQVWKFKDLDGWKYNHQDDNPDMQCVIEDGVLRIFTRADSRDRKKMRTTDKIYTTGRYTWKTYIPQMGKGDQASVGSWIYCDDQHEIDFEVGYGKKEVREELGAKDDEMIAYATTQAHPFQSIPVAIKTGWHIFEIDLSLVDGKYFVQWIIDGKVVCDVQQTFGNEYSFHIYCSVENLLFIGDHIPTQENYGLFDYVKYKFHN